MRTSRQLSTIVTMALLGASLGGVPVRAQQVAPALLVEAAGEAFPATAVSPPVFEAAPSAAAQFAGGAFGTGHEHIAVGVRFGGFAQGIGGNVRYYFNGGQIGVQLDATYYPTVKYGANEFSSMQFVPAALYRFTERTPSDAPVSFIPYSGLGLSIVRADAGDTFPPDLRAELEETRLGATISLGVELFFNDTSQLGISGELSYTTNGDAGEATLGGHGALVAGHWYIR